MARFVCINVDPLVSCGSTRKSMMCEQLNAYRHTHTHTHKTTHDHSHAHHTHTHTHTHEHPTGTLTHTHSLTCIHTHTLMCTHILVHHILHISGYCGCRWSLTRCTKLPSRLPHDEIHTLSCLSQPCVLSKSLW